MRFVEETGGSWTAEQLRAAEAEIEQQKREWEANRLATLKKAEEDAKRAAEEENDMLTYSREDAQNQVNNKSKRKSVNRRQISTARKQENRKNISRDRNRKRGESHDTILVQTVTRPALRSEADGARRILRNNIRTSNSTSLMRRATANSSRKSSISSEQSKPVKKSPSKRSANMRIGRGPGRPPKRARHREMTVSSGNEEETNGSAAEEIDENAIEKTANGNENDIDSVPTSGDTVKSRPQSEVSERPRSEELDDSECSLDVMIDSEEQDDSESQNRDTSDRSEDEEYEDDDEDSTIVQTDDAYSISSQEDEDTNDEYSKENISAMNSTAFDSTDNHIDTNTPRTTRSHGRLKINLFALDMSQILPELRAKRPNQMKRRRNATNASKNGNDESDDEPATLEGTNGLDMSVDSGSETSTRRNSRSTTRNNDLRKCDSAPPQPNRNLRRAVRSSSAKQTPPSPSVVKNAKNDGEKSNHNNTLDNWITMAHKTPKIILDKTECDKQQHMQNQKTCLTVNSKLPRRSDIGKR